MCETGWCEREIDCVQQTCQKVLAQAGDAVCLFQVHVCLFKRELPPVQGERMVLQRRFNRELFLFSSLLIVPPPLLVCFLRHRSLSQLTSAHLANYSLPHPPET